MIWRWVLVRTDNTLANLHDVLQIAFGWSDFHLHRFRVHGQRPLVSTQQEPLYWQLLGTDLLCRPSEGTRGCLIRRPWETRDWGRGRPRIDRYDRHRCRSAPLRRDPSPQGVAAKIAV